MDIREEFEKLEAIDRLMRLCGATYSEITRNYKIKSTGLYDVEVCSFINGAWYAFQEQQKKKNLAIIKIKAFEKNTSADKVLFLNDLLIELKGMLK